MSEDKYLIQPKQPESQELYWMKKFQDKKSEISDCTVKATL